MKKVTYIISQIDKALAFEWIAQHLNKEKYNLRFILLNDGDSQLERFLVGQKINVRRISLKGGRKSAFAFIKLLLHLLFNRPDTVHTHLRFGSLFGITAAFFLGIPQRIHTRHHSTSNHYYHPHAVKQDKWISALSTKVVSISDVVTEVLVDVEGTKSQKIVKIGHGFDLSYFENVEPVRISKVREKYQIDGSSPVAGMISRYLHLKGCDYVIEAFIEARRRVPNLHLVLANAGGPEAENIRKLLRTLPRGSYTEIVFEEDIAALYRCFDVFIHVPIDGHFEAFGQTYVESLASGVPSVFTLSGVAREFIVHESNALVVDFKDAGQIEAAVLRLLSDQRLREKLIENGKRSVQAFNLRTFITKLENLYDA